MRTLAGLLLVSLATAARAQPSSEAVSQALDAWQLEDALGMAQELMLIAPENPESWLAAARVQHQRGEHLSALALLDAAVDTGAPVEPWFRGLVETGARLQANGKTLESRHFRIRYLNKDEVVAHYAAPILEAAYRRIGGELEFLPAEQGEKIIVEVYPDAHGLAGATGLGVNEIETSGTIAVCKFHRIMITSPLATLNGYDWADTLAHELTHLVISKKSHDTIPIWLHEGIAKFYESLWKGEAGEALSPYAEKLLADALRKNDFITYEQMHPSMALLPSQEAASLAFAEVFTTIEFLWKRHGADKVPAILERTRDGMPLERALRETLGVGLKKLETSWRRYLKKRPFREVAGVAPRRIELASSEKEAGGERPLEAIADREAHNFARLGELLQLRGHDNAAVLEYEKAYERAGLRYATLVNRLARAYLATGRSHRALALIESLLEAHPTEGDAHLLAGRIRLQNNELSKAREHFEAVRLQNPFNPEVHAALAQVYGAQGHNTEAVRARDFAALTSKPRPTRKYELPPRPGGNATVSIVTPRWGQIRINGGPPMATPAWNVPVAGGETTIDVGGTLHTLNVASGAATIHVLN
jgi:tetratricopeptide (TPR) repeat protein